MVEKTRGLIIRVLPLTETSLIIDWLTPDFGRISTAAKGARGAKSPLRSKLDLFYLGEFTFTRSKRSELHTLGEVKIVETHPLLRKDIHALQQASYCARLLVQATEKETPLPELFQVLVDAVKDISAEAVIRFELALLAEMGVAPTESLTSDQLGRFIIYHLGRIPTGRNEALADG